MKKQPSYEDLLKKVNQLESELDEIKTSKNINPNHTSDIFYKICEYSQNAVALFETLDKGESFNIKYFNQKASEKENVNREEIIGKKLRNQFPTITKSGFFKSLQSVYKTGIPQEFPYISFSSDKLTEWKHNYIYKLSEFEIVSIYIDITNEKLKESALKEHQDKLQLAMSAAEYYTFEISLPNKIIKTDRKLYLDLDYSEFEITELLAKTGSLVHKKDFEQTELILKEITSRSEQNFSSEIRIRNKNSKWQWFSLSGKITDFFEDKKPKRILGLIKNIQNEKEFHIKLEESENRLKLAMESANQALIDWNIIEDKIYFSPEWYTMLGYNPDDQEINYNFTVQISHPDDVRVATKKLESHIKGESELFNSKVRMKTKSGDWKWILTHGKIVDRDKNGKPLRAIGIQTDITRIKESEQKLIESQVNFKQLSENINDAFWLRSIDHNLVYANPACFKIIGKNFTNIFEDFDAYYNWIHPADREFIRRKRESNLKSPNENHFYEHRIINSSGETKWLWIRTFPVFNEKGELYRRAGIASDITEHKELISDLLQAKDKAEESDQLKSAFLANMSHEIRTPMNGILGFAELLKDSDVNDQEKKNYIKIIDSNGKQLLNLIDDIIDISKIEVNQINLKNTIADLRPLLNDIQYFFFKEQSRLEKEYIKLEVYAPSISNNIINTDISRLQQIFNNLINNALKFTEQGTIKIGYTKENFDDKEYYKFYVSDTGIGISDSTKSVIFERFGQVPPSNNKNQHGTGLGLAISKGLVELLGGEIWFESTPEKGSIFYFTIPIRSSSNNGEKNSKKNSKKMIKKWENLEILVVEDDADNLEFIKRLLEKQGAKVFIAKTGTDAVNMIINNDTIKIVLMDIRLPDIDGFEATQRIKAIKPKLPIIAQTAYAMYNDKEMCLENGCDDYISKPLEKVILFEKINNYIYN
jgi:PAS domain S-box-containing protein